MKVQYVPANDDAAIEIVEVPDDPALQLQTLQRLVGGYVESITSSRLTFAGNMMLTDEDGRIKHRKPNLRATQMAAYPATIVGDVVIVGRNTAGTKWIDVNINN